MIGKFVVIREVNTAFELRHISVLRWAAIWIKIDKYMMNGMSSYGKRSAIESSREQSLTQTSTPVCLPSISTLTSFQIINPELTPSHFENDSPQKPNPYYIDYDKLFKDKIDPLHRYKLIKWLQIQVFRQKYYREVFAYTTYYLDAFLYKCQKVELKDLQIIALAALLIATKVEGGAFPKLGKNFDIDEILEFQKKIYIKLNYFLSPKTYVHILNQYIQCWDRFINKSKVYSLQNQYLTQSLESFQRYRSINQKLQFLNMASQSHNFNYRKLTFNLFYLQNKINFINLSIIDLTKQNLNKFVYDSFYEFDKYSLIFQQFIEFASDLFQCPSLDFNIGMYLSSFISIPISKSTPNRKCHNYYSYLKMQTMTEEAIKVMDKIVKKK